MNLRTKRKRGASIAEEPISQPDRKRQRGLSRGNKTVAQDMALAVAGKAGLNANPDRGGTKSPAVNDDGGAGSEQDASSSVLKPSVQSVKVQKCGRMGRKGRNGPEFERHGTPIAQKPEVEAPPLSIACGPRLDNPARRESLRLRKYPPRSPHQDLVPSGSNDEIPAPSSPSTSADASPRQKIKRPRAEYQGLRMRIDGVTVWVDNPFDDIEIEDAKMRIKAARQLIALARRRPGRHNKHVVNEKEGNAAAAKEASAEDERKMMEAHGVRLAPRGPTCSDEVQIHAQIARDLETRQQVREVIPYPTGLLDIELRERDETAQFEKEWEGVPTITTLVGKHGDDAWNAATHAQKVQTCMKQADRLWLRVRQLNQRIENVKRLREDVRLQLAETLRDEHVVLPWMMNMIRQIGELLKRMKARVNNKEEKVAAWTALMIVLKEDQAAAEIE